MRESDSRLGKVGGAMVSTVFQQILQRGKEIGVKEGEEKNKLQTS